MLQYLKEVISDGKTKIPSSRRFVLLLSVFTLCFGFLVSTLAFLWGSIVNENIVIGLAGIIASLSGSTYTFTKIKETTKKSESATSNIEYKHEDSGSN